MIKRFLLAVTLLLAGAGAMQAQFNLSKATKGLGKTVEALTLTDDQMSKSKRVLTDYINSDESNSIAIIYSDIFNQRGLYDTYSLINNSYNKDKYDMEISGNEDLTSGNESITKNSSYQLIENDNEFLIILLENNVVIHYDPLTSMITGFNFSESYMH